MSSLTFLNYQYDLTRSNETNIAPHEHFSETLVIGRALRADIKGYWSNGGLIGWTPIEAEVHGHERQRPASTEELFINEDRLTQIRAIEALDEKARSRKKVFEYTGNAGLQGDFYASINLLLVKTNLKGVDRLRVLRALSVLFTSFSIAALVLVIATRFGKVAGLAIFFVFLVSPWYGEYSSNLYWAPFLWLLPMSYSLWRFVPPRLFDNTTRSVEPFRFREAFVLGGLIMVNVLTGLEFISCLLVSACLPVILSPMIRGNWKQVVSNGFKSAGASLLGVLVGIWVFLLKISIPLGGFPQALETFVGRVEKRTSLKDTSANPSALPDAELGSLLSHYFLEISVLAVGSITFSFLQIVFVLLSFFFTLSIVRIATAVSDRQFAISQSIVVLFLFLISLFGSVSWLIIGSGHSQFHPYIVPLVFHFPAIVFMVVLVVFQFWKAYDLTSRASLFTIICTCFILGVCFQFYDVWKYNHDRSQEKLHQVVSLNDFTIKQFEKSVEISTDCERIEDGSNIYISIEPGSKVRSKIYKANQADVWLPMRKAPMVAYGADKCRYYNSYGGYGVSNIKIGQFSASPEQVIDGKAKPLSLVTIEIPSPDKTLVRRSNYNNFHFSDGISKDRKSIFIHRRDVHPQELTHANFLRLPNQEILKVQFVHVDEFYILVRVKSSLPDELPQKIHFFSKP